MGARWPNRSSSRRWFGSKARTILRRYGGRLAAIGLGRLFAAGADRVHARRCGNVCDSRAACAGRRSRASIRQAGPLLALVTITHLDNESARLVDAMADAAIAQRWLELIAKEEEIAGRHGSLVGTRLPRLDALRAEPMRRSKRKSVGRTEQ